MWHFLISVYVLGLIYAVLCAACTQQTVWLWREIWNEARASSDWRGVGLIVLGYVLWPLSFLVIVWDFIKVMFRRFEK